MSNKFIEWTATFLGVGRTPVMPGTMASLAGTVIVVVLHGHLALYIGVVLLVTALGFMTSGRMEQIAGKKDPSCIVIDEVAGVMIAFFLLPVSAPVLLTTFFVFRAFDMFKIYPVNKFEAMEGGTGVMMDDIIAGLYTNITMQAAVRLAGL
jgi:phosphatidylglycerophosphatase A